MGNFIHVNNYVLRAEHTPDLDSVVKAKLRAAAGLVHLDQREYAKVRALTLRGATFVLRFVCVVLCCCCARHGTEQRAACKVPSWTTKAGRWAHRPREIWPDNVFVCSPPSSFT